ncbi:MAG: hypothetical protein ABIO65_08640, partial [Nitrospiria bacterium]
LESFGTPLESHGIYTTSEVAVASVLWDVFDGSSESGDNLSAGLQAVWNVMEGFATANPALPSITLETFGLFYGFDKLKNVATLRSIEFVRDQYEPGDGDWRTAPALSSSETCHTLFPEGDIDHAKFVVGGGAARSVIIETFNLTNGADTVLSILADNGTPFLDTTNQPLGNDDTAVPYRPDRQRCNQKVEVPAPYLNGSEESHPNNGQRYASRVSFTFQPGTYYVKVTAGTKPRAGRLGSYGLSIAIQ